MSELGWVVLTTGDRPAELSNAVRSILRQDAASSVVVFANGCPVDAVRAGLPVSGRVEVVGSAENLGVPGGRHAAIDHLAETTCLIGFLDDDAELLGDDIHDRIRRAFVQPDVAAISFRLVDEQAVTSRRHIPRIGSKSSGTAGDVATFLGGASVLRRSSYAAAGGYWPELFYGHEELDLAWRLADLGGRVRYEPSIRVFHPHTDIGRHRDGWRMTGRNRVRIARRNLPLPVLSVHVLSWLGLGVYRAPSGCRRSYLAGWCAGWRDEIDRQPIRWSTVLELGRRGRLPII